MKHVPPSPDSRFPDVPDYAWFRDELQGARDKIATHVRRTKLRRADTALDQLVEGSDVAGVRRHARPEAADAADATRATRGERLT